MKIPKRAIAITAIIAVTAIAIAAVFNGQNGYMHGAALSVITYITGRAAWSKDV